MLIFLCFDLKVLNVSVKPNLDHSSITIFEIEQLHEKEKKDLELTQELVGAMKEVRIELCWVDFIGANIRQFNAKALLRKRLTIYAYISNSTN